MSDGNRKILQASQSSTGIISTLALYTIVCILIVLPILIINFPLLTDYPNHLARLFVDQHLTQSDALAKFYHLNHGFYPYKAMDAIIDPLEPYLGLERAGSVFVALAVLSPFLGTIALSRALWGRVGVTPLLGALFTYNAAVSWGFLGFTFTLGLAFGGLALWIVTEAWTPWRRLPVFLAISSVIYLSHVFVFAMYLLLLAGWELENVVPPTVARMRRAIPTLALIAAQILPAVVALPFMATPNVGVPVTLWGDVSAHLWALAAPLQFSFDRGEIWLVLVPAVALICALPFMGARVSARMGGILGLFTFIVVVMPTVVHAVFYLHLRFPIALAFLGAAALRLEAGVRVRACIAGVVLVLLCVRLALAYQCLAQLDRDVTEFRAKEAVVDVGARVMPVVLNVTEGRDRNFRVGDTDVTKYLHIYSLLVIDRAAFYPLIFQMFELVANEPYVRYSRPQGMPVLAHKLADLAGYAEPRPGVETFPWDWRHHFDYIVVLDFGRDPGPLPAHLELAASGSFFHIYKIV